MTSVISQMTISTICLPLQPKWSVDAAAPIAEPGTMQSSGAAVPGFVQGRKSLPRKYRRKCMFDNNAN